MGRRGRVVVPAAAPPIRRLLEGKGSDQPWGVDGMTGSQPRPIPLVDVRDGGPIRHAREGRERARALRDECLDWLPGAAAAAMPLLDAVTRHWLRRSASPYVGEIEAIAAELGFSGVWFLNGCYQWGCTTRACVQDGVPWLLRTLDWPFPGLGRNLEIVRMAGVAGDFVGVGWPGYAGVLTAMAPGRFAGAMNQGPLARRTRHPWLRPLDIGLNAVHTWRRVRHMPPDQLLRSVFEHCPDYDAARRTLQSTPVARPAIFTLAGRAAGACCVIERTEEHHVTRDVDAAAANDWREPRAGWEARVGGDLFWSCDGAAAAQNSRARRDALMQWRGRMGVGDFGWVAPPVLNPFTRMAVEACAATGVLRVVGYERVEPGALPQAVTAVGEFTPALAV